MGLKKYEIITVGSDKRVRALRSWQVGGRYVNIGDVGGIVYDEKTLSQDGACWLFRGNFGFPGARIGGDSIVDVGEAALGSVGSSNLDILGTSTVVGAPVRFSSEQTGADAVVLSESFFEQGGYDYVRGIKWEDMRASSPNYVRTKSPIFAGGVSRVLECGVAGYLLSWYALDRDGVTITASATVTTGEGVTATIVPCQYFLIQLTKNPVAAIIPADATAAQITFTGTYETKLSIIDSRVEINPAINTAFITIRSGGTYAISPGSKYPDSVIQNSRVTVNSKVTGERVIRLMTELVNVNATIDATTENAQAVGIYHGVNNLTFTGLATLDMGVAARSLIQAYNCDNMVVKPTNFPGSAEMQTAGVPIRFYNCNLNNGRFYHHAQIANTYRDINFDLATADLGKAIASGQILASAEVEGMYRLYSTTGSLFGALAEAHDSVKSLNMTGGAATYGTTIYKDAYLSGLFDIAGTNVFGHKVRSHPLAQVLNVQPRAVQGGLTLTTGLPPVPSTESTRVRTEKYFRVNGANGISVHNIPAGLEARIVYLDGSGNYVALGDWYAGSTSVPNVQLINTYAYLLFRKTGDAAITPEDLAGVTVTVYNGCKIVNTGSTAVSMKGNIRVEDNATLLNASITGTGYFGGNAVASGLIVNGCAYMRDNASFTKTAGSTTIRDLKMTENAYAVMGDFSLNGRIHLSDNARFIPRSAELFEGDLIMKDNAVVSGNAAVIIGGVITMKDNARVSGGTVALSAYGDITLCGSYNQTVNKTWIGKRVIDSQNAPEYDNNVKTQYDF